MRRVSQRGAVLDAPERIRGLNDHGGRPVPIASRTSPDGVSPFWNGDGSHRRCPRCRAYVRALRDIGDARPSRSQSRRAWPGRAPSPPPRRARSRHRTSSVRHIHTGQLAQHGLVLVGGLQLTLHDLRPDKACTRYRTRARAADARRRWGRVIVAPAAEETDQAVGVTILLGEIAEVGQQLAVRQRRRQRQGRFNRTADGMSSKRSSTEPSPICRSISARSSAVSGRYLCGCQSACCVIRLPIPPASRRPRHPAVAPTRPHWWAR